MIVRRFANVPRIERRAAMASLAAALALSVLKFIAYFATNSSAIFSDAVESIVNVAASAFAIYSLYLSHQPADEDHPYGHGKVEFISAAVEGGMVLAVALVSVVKAIDTIIHHVELHMERLGLGILLLGIALAVNGVLGWVLAGIGRKQGSATLVADGRHLISDALTSVGAIVGVIVVRLTAWKYADPAAALVVAGYVAVMGVELVRDAIAGLMDRQDLSDEQLLRSILDAHVAGREPRICSYHKLRHRHSGRYHWVDFHIMVPADWDIRRGHQVASRIEYEIEQALRIGNATAHVEPCADAGCRTCDELEHPPS
jgi:cation diffusion facilitator family transporter